MCVEMGNLSSRFQSPSQGPEESAEGAISSRRHGCECKKRKRNAQCDCDSEQEEEDDMLDTPRRQVHSRNLIHLSIHLNILGSENFVWFAFIGQEEIEKHLKVHLSDLVSKWRK